MERCRLSSLMSPPYVGDNQISKSRKSYLPRKCTKKYFLKIYLILIIDKRRKRAKKYSLNQNRAVLKSKSLKLSKTFDLLKPFIRKP